MMKNKGNHKFKFLVLAVLLLAFNLGCEREVSDDAVDATFPTTSEIYTDDPVGLTDEFFVSFDPALGANPDVFGTDESEAYEGISSIRIDVPSPDDPGGGFVGGIFLDRGAGRDLTGYDALTFWAKASTSASIDLFGFGADFGENKYAASVSGTTLTTGWRKIIIPIPDPSKLVQERGMFIFSAGTLSTNGVAYTIWLDEMRFENLGNIAQPRPAILGGQDQSAQAPIDASFPITGLTQTFNLANGQDATVDASPSYFDFTSSNNLTANVSELGVVNVVAGGESTITASLGGVDAAGSLTVEGLDIEVISIFSDVFANVPVDNYNGFYEPFQETEGGAVTIAGNNIIDYTNLNFVAIEFYGRDGSDVDPIDATAMEFLHIDIRPNEIIQPTDFIRIQLHNNFTQPSEVSGSFTITGADLIANEWMPFDIPLSSFAGLSSRDAVGMMLFVSDGTISNVSLDNIYFYAE